MTPSSSDALAIARGDDGLPDVGPPLARLVAEYLSAEWPRFTGRHFHVLGDAAADGWSANDLAAVVRY